ncbi:MAG: transglutaminase domain-containing protein, partial [Thermodesulfovibrionales bacterium]
EIQAKAAELNHNPTKIYNWVRNNIEYVPTYGSIQGANMCLQTKLCNDFDTASLLIALLRASEIHARCVYGTIELPIEKVKNWLGGFTDSMEALRLLASARIPVKGLTEGGTIKAVQLEHIWVEAWVDYIPSRGARHKVGDTWIPLDASFKQYSYTQGIDIKSAVPFDAQSFIDQIKNTATINETEGYVTNVNSLYIQQTMNNYQTQVQNYITQNYPNATVGDVLGKKEINKQEFPYLMGTLPYKKIVKGSTYASIPDTLRHKLTFNLIKDMYDEFIGTPINITKSLPELAGKKITLSYSPATQADENVINSYLPKPHPDGTPIQPNELPSSLPAYLINLKPELRIDGVVVATGTSVGMGNTETFTMTFSAPKQSPDVITNQIGAGEYLGIGLDLGRISQEQMTTLKTKLEATKAKIEAGDLTGLTQEDIFGDMLFFTAALYGSRIDGYDIVLAHSLGVKAVRCPSEAIFQTVLGVNYIFGIPVRTFANGLMMDADRNISFVNAFDGNNNKRSSSCTTLE